MVVMAYLYAQAEQKTKAINSHVDAGSVVLYMNSRCSPKVWTDMAPSLGLWIVELPAGEIRTRTFTQKWSRACRQHEQCSDIYIGLADPYGRQGRSHPSGCCPESEFENPSFDLCHLCFTDLSKGDVLSVPD